MEKVRELSKRFWSLALVVCLPMAELFAEQSRLWPDYEMMRAILSAMCIALLVHSWLMQRDSVKSGWRLTFWTLLLLSFVLEFLWLGLNSVRGSTYPVDFQADNRAYWFAVVWQDRIALLAEALAGICGSWIAIDLARWISHRLGGRQECTTSAPKLNR